ncbi:Mechanosensitive channel MscK precursor [Phycisphaerae bacterium RAS1]|nr:Mechanosensitive channel MscK precursor [Phycisphaerae bacterium RAS1]
MSKSRRYPTHRLNHFAAACALACALVFAAGSVAQDTQATTQPASQPAVIELTGGDLTSESVQQQLRQAEGSTEFGETLKAKLIDAYRQTLLQIESAATWNAKAAEFQRLKQEAPEQLALVRARLAAVSEPASRPVSQPAADMPLPQMEQRLAELERDLNDQRAVAQRLENESANRNERRAAIPKRLAETGETVEQVNRELAAVAPADEPPELTLGRRRLLVARRAAILAERKALEEELSCWNARAELLTASRDEARLIASGRERAVEEWARFVQDRRRAEAEEQAALAQREARSSLPAVRSLAEENEQLARRRGEAVAATEAAAAELRKATEESDRLQQQFDEARDKLQKTGRLGGFGPQVRRFRDGLNKQRNEFRRSVAAHTRLAEEIDARSSELAGLRFDPRQSDSHVRKTIETVAPPDREFVAQKVKELLQTRNDYIQALRNAYETQWTMLVRLADAQRSVVNKAQQLGALIDEQAFWLRSAQPLWQARWPDNLIPDAADWAALPRKLIADARANLQIYLAALVCLGILADSRFRAPRALKRIAARVRGAYTDSMRLTIEASLWTGAAALLWPSLLYFAAWRCDAMAGAGEFECGLSFGLRRGASVLLAWLLIRRVSRADGLGAVHFRWAPEALRVVRREFAWSAWIAVPVAFCTAYSELSADDVWRDSVARMIFIAGMLGLAILALRVLHPVSGVPAALLKAAVPSWLSRTRLIWYPLLVGVPLVLAITAAMGYSYTAVQFARRTIATLCITLSVVAVHALAIRAVFVAQRSMAIEQWRKARARVAQEQAERHTGAAPAATLSEDVPIDIGTIGAQTGHLLRSLSVFALLIGGWLIWVDILPAFSFVQRMELWSNVVEIAEGEGAATLVKRVVPVTLADLGLALLVLTITYILTRNLPGLLEITILSRLPLEPAGRYAAATVTRYLLVILGVGIAFSTVGWGWSKIQWLAAGITVGLGFGLQEIFANFVSGLIILFERPIRLGDIVTINNVSGMVTKIRIRATTLLDADRRELIIPNKEFVTGQVSNWTLSDTVQRVIVTVGVAYGSDVRVVADTLQRVAKANRLVLEDPPPMAFFLNFGASTLNFDLRVHVRGVEDMLQAQHELNSAIDAAFREAGIEIAFPQQDVHIRSLPPGGDPAFPIPPRQAAG